MNKIPFIFFSCKIFFILCSSVCLFPKLALENNILDLQEMQKSDLLLQYFPFMPEINEIYSV